MKPTIYDLAYLALTPPVAASIAWKKRQTGKYEDSLPHLLGKSIDAESAENWQNGCIWIHGVSVGETVAARAMLPALRDKYPNVPILLTTHTETGQATARSYVPELASASRYLPFDYSWLIEKFITKYKPRLFLPMEAELWPNLLLTLKRHSVPIVMLNGKISEKSFRGYSRFRKLLQKPFSAYSACCVQSQGDMDRLVALGLDRNIVTVTGNCKFDVQPPQLSEADILQLREQCGIAPDARVIVAGSTHRTEEEIVLKAFQDLRGIADATLVIVPRHPERFNDVWNLVLNETESAYRVSSGTVHGSGRPAVVLVDRMGLLAKLYSLAEVAIVAGSYLPEVGGHSLLEPAVFGVPIVHGPYMHSQKEMTRVLNADSGVQTVSADLLSAKLEELLANPSHARKLGEQSRAAAFANQGAVNRNLEVIAKVAGERLR